MKEASAVDPIASSTMDRRLFLLSGFVAIAYLTPPRLMESAIAAPASPLAERERRPLGFSAAPVPPGSKEVLKLERDRGMIIVAIARGGLAEQAGLRKGDVLLAIDGKPIVNQADLDAALAAAAPSHRAVAEVSRQGAILAIALNF